MRFALLSLLLLLLVAAPAIGDEDKVATFGETAVERCKELSFVAREAMTARQEGTPLSETLPATQNRFNKWLRNEWAEQHDADPADFEEALPDERARYWKDLNKTIAQMVMLTYKGPAYTLEENRQDAINEFENEVFAACYSGFLNFEDQPPVPQQGGSSLDAVDSARRTNELQRQEDLESMRGMWVVQLGTFSNEENAEKLAANLRKQGYAAFLNQLMTENGRLYRVRIGPQKDRQSAEAMANRLAKVGQEGQVVPHP